MSKASVVEIGQLCTGELLAILSTSCLVHLVQAFAVSFVRAAWVVTMAFTLFPAEVIL